MEARFQLRKVGTMPVVATTNYSNIIDSLRYLVNTSPYLVYFVGYVSRFMEAPKEEHHVAVKHNLRYVPGTRGWGVRNSAERGKNKLELVGYSDSDIDGCNNTNGMIFLLSGGAVCWK